MLDFFNSVDWHGRTEILLAAFFLGYLLGAVPFGLLFSWAAGAGDVRRIGSGNIGATNVLRTGNRWAAAATLVCDAGKAALAVWFAGALHGELAGVLAGAGAFLGHVFPVWLRFRGGKGVATFFGILLAFAWPAGLLALATWIAVAWAWRLSSLAALVAAALAPLYMMFYATPRSALLALVLAIFIFGLHRENIRRIAAGREPRIGVKTQRCPR
ncbi:MAG: glycerol-3-phosphate 1-O-acyltransferase PlsY [Rhizomicrobium sp.]